MIILPRVEHSVWFKVVGTNNFIYIFLYINEDKVDYTDDYSIHNDDDLEYMDGLNLCCIHFACVSNEKIRSLSIWRSSVL